MGDLVTMWQELVHTLQYPWMQNALLCLLLLAPMSALVGVHVVNFRMAFFSDAISHSAFAGVAIGLLLGMDPRMTMVGFAVLVGVGIVAIGRRTNLSSDAVIGVFFSTAVAFGLAIVSRSQGVARNLQMFLYGDILTISTRDLVLMAVLLAVLAVFQVVGFNRLLYVGLSPTLAGAHRVPVKAYQYTMAALLSLVAIFSVWALGVLLVTALLIVPAAAARNLARSAGGMFWWALIISLSSAVIGLAASVPLRTATGATIILIAAIWFALSAAVRIVRRER